MRPSDAAAWFEEVSSRALGAVGEDDGGGTTYYPAASALEWVADAESAIEQVFPERHAIRRQWTERLSGAKGNEWQVRDSARIDALRAIFRSATSQLKSGRLSTLVAGIRAEDASELLDQADALTASGHLVAGAVIAGGALETTLRHLCDGAGILPTGAGSISKYQQAMAQARKSGAEVISLGDEKQVIAWGDARNEAAHTPVDFARNHAQAEVQVMIAGVRVFVAKYT